VGFEVHVVERDDPDLGLAVLPEPVAGFLRLLRLDLQLAVDGGRQLVADVRDP